MYIALKVEVSKSMSETEANNKATTEHVNNTFHLKSHRADSSHAIFLAPI